MAATGNAKRNNEIPVACVCLKMLQIQPDDDDIIEFNDDHLILAVYYYACQFN